MKSKFKKELEEFFDTYPNEKECLLFADGQIFLTKNKGYAKQFEDQTGLAFEQVQRPSKEVIVDSDVMTADKLASSTNAEIVAFGKTLGLDLNPKTKKADLLAAIEAATKVTADKSSVKKGSEEDTDLEGKEGSEEDTDLEGKEGSEDYKPVNNQ